jgi:hypothetical protein
MLSPDQMMMMMMIMIIIIIIIIIIILGHAVGYLVEALCYKAEGRGFESR